MASVMGQPRVLDGAAVRSLRRAADLSRTDLATAAEIGVRHLANIELYGAQPSTGLLGRLVAALERSLGREIDLDGELFRTAPVTPAMVPTEKIS